MFPGADDPDADQSKAVRAQKRRERAGDFSEPGGGSDGSNLRGVGRALSLPTGFHCPPGSGVATGNRQLQPKVAQNSVPAPSLVVLSG